MPIILSALFRIIYFCIVLFVAFWVGIAVAMGFDAGVSFVASLFAFLYLFTFVPALLLTIIPLPKLVKPPFVLKLWYWWIAILTTIYAILLASGFFKIMLGASVEIFDRIVHSNNYATICRQVVDAEPGTRVDIRIGGLNGASTSYTAQTTRYCSTVSLSNGPIKLFMGDPQAKYIALDIPVTGGGEACIGLTPAYKGASPQSADWSARVIDCTH